MEHRHLIVPEGTPPEELDAAALDDILDRGDLDDWKALAAAVKRHPQGRLATRLLSLVEAHPMYGTGPLWHDWIAGQRDLPRAPIGAALRRARAHAGLTQQELAGRLGMTQPEVSKLERRGDARLSSVRAYVRALGGELELTARFPDAVIELSPEA